MMSFKEFDGINQTPAIPLIARGWAEMIKNGVASMETVCNWDHQAIIAFDDSFGSDEPVGIITYDHQKWRKTLWIAFGYVVPSARRHGVYRALWDRLIGIGQKIGVEKIQGGIHVDNHSMLECSRKLGRKDLFITTSFDVPKFISAESIRELELQP